MRLHLPEIARDLPTRRGLALAAACATVIDALAEMSRGEVPMGLVSVAAWGMAMTGAASLGWLVWGDRGRKS